MYNPPDNNEKNEFHQDVDNDEEFENLWYNLNSRRKCESVHRPHKLRNFKKKNN